MDSLHVFNRGVKWLLGYCKTLGFWVSNRWTIYLYEALLLLFFKLASKRVHSCQSPLYFSVLQSIDTFDWIHNTSLRCWFYRYSLVCSFQPLIMSSTLPSVHIRLSAIFLPSSDNAAKTILWNMRPTTNKPFWGGWLNYWRSLARWMPWFSVKLWW